MIGKLLCRIGRHEWALLHRHAQGGRWYLRSDSCARCGLVRWKDEWR